MSSNKQNEILNKFTTHMYGIITCIYCLGEGWDLPLLDGVVFSENMISYIRTLQSSLRPCRKVKKPSKIDGLSKMAPPLGLEPRTL